MKDYRHSTQFEKKVLVVTSWDDADPHTFRLFDLIEKYDLKATFFIPITALEKGYITTSDLRFLARNHEVGAHSVSHVDLTKLDDATLFREIYDSKKIIEQVIKKRVSSFCYPSGFLNRRVVEHTRKAGYKCSRTCVKYSLEWPRDLFRVKTTIQAANQHPLSVQTFRFLRLACMYKNFRALTVYSSWVKVGKTIFDVALEKGGVFHLWGHASEIEENNDWAGLEEILKYISRRENVSYLSLKEAVEFNNTIF